MTTRIILAIAAALATASPALAETAVIPEYRGEWCNWGDRPYYSPKSEIQKMEKELQKAREPMPSGCEKDGAGWIKMTASRYYYAGGEANCKAVKINRGKPEDTITFDCLIEEDKVVRTFRFAITPGSGSYGHLHRRLYIEDAKDKP